MNAFHGNPQLKQRFEQRAKLIGAQFSEGLRNLREGQYAWQVRKHIMPLIPRPAKINDNDEATRLAAALSFGSELDIPAHIAFAQQSLFDNMHETNSPSWPLRFARAVAVNADLTTVWRDLALFILTEEHIGVANFTQTSEQAHAVQQVISLYEANSEDSASWRAAASACRRSSYTNHHNGHGRDAQECLESVGAAAAQAAANLAEAAVNPSYAEAAVQNGPWALRHLAEYHYYVKGERHHAHVDERGNVNVGEALWMSSLNRRDHDAAAKKGEYDRWAAYQAYSDKLIALIKKRAPRSPGLLGRVFSSRLFGIN